MANIFEKFGEIIEGKFVADKKYEVLCGFNVTDAHGGDHRWEIGDPLKDGDLGDGDIAALIEMEAITESE